MSVRAIDPWVNVNMGEREPPAWLLRVKEDYFRGGDEFFRSAILSLDVAAPSKHVLAFGQALPGRIAFAAGVDPMRPMPEPW